MIYHFHVCYKPSTNMGGYFHIDAVIDPNFDRL